jgi:hypothetical protein
MMVRAHRIVARCFAGPAIDRIINGQVRFAGTS